MAPRQGDEAQAMSETKRVGEIGGVEVYATPEHARMLHDTSGQWQLAIGRLALRRRGDVFVVESISFRHPQAERLQNARPPF